MSFSFRHFRGIYLGYVVVALKKNCEISRGWTNYSIPAAPIYNPTKSNEVQKPLEDEGFFIFLLSDVASNFIVVYYSPVIRFCRHLTF